MGRGTKDEENQVSDDENITEKDKLRAPEMGDDIELKKIPVKTRDAAYPEVIIGHSNPWCKVHHLKYMLIGFNSFITTLGLVLLALSVWFLVNAEYKELESKLSVDNFKLVCIIFIISSIIIIVIGFLGCFGAVTERRWLLISFICLFGVIFVLELAAVILVFSAPYSGKIEKTLENKFLEQIEARPKDDSARYFTDFIQSHLECCGASSFLDYGKENEAPNSCSSDTTQTVYNYGCARKILSFLRSKAGIIGGIALVILLLQLLVLLVAGCLVKSLDVESHYFM